MSFSTKISNGWTIAKNSFKVLRENRQLILFPILSGISIILLMVSFFVAVAGFNGWDLDNLREPNTFTSYALIFAFYIVNYFVIVFFNMALIHCTSLYFKGEEVTIKKGIEFSMSRIKFIFLWAVFAGIIGGVLKIVQENSGALGKIITAIVGVVWNVATFFVVPVIAYENLGPVDAFKRSSKMMKEKWGESVGAAFSFFLIQIVAVLAIVTVAFLISTLNIIAGVAFAVLGILILTMIMSAIKTIFISAVYHNVTGDPVALYNEKFIDNLFEYKKK